MIPDGYYEHTTTTLEGGVRVIDRYCIQDGGIFYWWGANRSWAVASTNHNEMRTRKQNGNLRRVKDDRVEDWFRKFEMDAFEGVYENPFDYTWPQFSRDDTTRRHE